jgi:hypothetical protein
MSVKRWYVSTLSKEEVVAAADYEALAARIATLEGELAEAKKLIADFGANWNAAAADRIRDLEAALRGVIDKQAGSGSVVLYEADIAALNAALRAGEASQSDSMAAWERSQLERGIRSGSVSDPSAQSEASQSEGGKHG